MQRKIAENSWWHTKWHRIDEAPKMPWMDTWEQMKVAKEKVKKYWAWTWGVRWLCKGQTSKWIQVRGEVMGLHQKRTSSTVGVKTWGKKAGCVNISLVMMKVLKNCPCFTHNFHMLVLRNWIEYRRVGTTVTPTINNLMCSLLAHSFSSPAPWIKCSILLTEMSSKSPDCIKWQPRSLNLNVAKASTVTERVRPFQLPVCIYHTHRLFTSPSLNRCPFKWQCPVSNPVIILSWFLLRLSKSPALIPEGFLRKPVACLCPRRDCQCSSCFLRVLIPDHLPGNLCRYTKCRIRA